MTAAPPIDPTYRTRFPGKRLARDIEFCLTRGFSPLEPEDPVPDALLAHVNRLLRRGARFLAPRSDLRHAQPFPASIGGFPARLAVRALFCLLVRIDPKVYETLRP